MATYIGTDTDTDINISASLIKTVIICTHIFMHCNTADITTFLHKKLSNHRKIMAIVKNFIMVLRTWLYAIISQSRHRSSEHLLK